MKVEQIKATCEKCKKEFLMSKKSLEQGGLICSTCRRKATLLAKYGVDNPMKSKTFIEKLKSSNFQKYGVTCTLQSKEVLEQIASIEEELGCKVSQKEETILKRKKTCLERYGSESPFESKEILNKAKVTLKAKYGVENPSQLNSVKIKKLERLQQKTPEERKEIRRKANKHNAYKASDGEVFDSSWELRYYEYCKEKGYEIIREPVELTFEYEGKVHHCYPDFSVNGQLIEVKGNHFLEDGKMVNPYDKNQNELYEAKHKCMLENNVKFLFKEELEEIFRN